MLQCTDIKKQPTANIIDGNVQLHILSLIPDNFQGVREIVSDGLPKPSGVNIVTKKTYKVLWAQQNTIYLRPEDLSTKRLDRLRQMMKKNSLSNFCLTNVRNLKVFLEVHGRDIDFAKSEQSYHLTSTDAAAVRLLLPLHRKRYIPESYSIVCIYVKWH